MEDILGFLTEKKKKKICKSLLKVQNSLTAIHLREE